MKKKSISQIPYSSVAFVLILGLFLAINGCTSAPRETPKPAAASQPTPTSSDEAAWQRIKDSDSPHSFEAFLNSNPRSPHAPEARDKLEALKARLRIARYYDGPPLQRSKVSVLVTTLREIRAPGFSKPGVAFIAGFDRKDVSTYTEEIECLPGTHTVTILVQFRPDNVPEGTFAVKSTRSDKKFIATAGHKYQLTYDAATRQVSIQDMLSSSQATGSPMDEGLRLEKEGRLEEALEIYRKVASERPNFADVYARMAYTLRKMGYARQSSEMLKKCQKIGGFKQNSTYAMDAHFLGGWFLTDSMSVPAPTDEQELLTTESPAKALMYSFGNYWVLIIAREGDGVPIINNKPTVGVGSELRFDRGDWMTFLGKQYRKGGVRVLKTGIEFFNGTERLVNENVEVFASGKWTKR